MPSSQLVKYGVVLKRDLSKPLPTISSLTKIALVVGKPLQSSQQPIGVDVADLVEAGTI